MSAVTASFALRGSGAVGRLLPGRRPVVVGALAAALLCLAVLAAALALAAGRAADGWSDAAAGSATLAIVADEAQIEGQARAALAVLRDAQGVRRVRVMEPAEQRALLAPWLGTEIAVEGMALPLMIEVETVRGTLDTASLSAALAEAAPGAVFEDHSAWTLPLAATAERQRRAAAAGALVLVGSLAAVSALWAGGAMAAASGAVATLKGIGMPDALLARVMLARLLPPLGAGALAGVAVAVAVVGRPGPEAAAGGIALGFVGWEWLVPPALLVLAVTLSAGAALLAVRRVLRRAP